MAQHLHVPLYALGEMPIGDYLDEVDLAAYLYDLDNPPKQESPL